MNDRRPAAKRRPICSQTGRPIVGFGSNRVLVGTTAFVKVCGCRPHDDGAAPGPAYANLQWRKPREGGRGGAATPGGLGGRECEHNFCDMARTLRMDENAFRGSCNFRELFQN